MMIASFDNYKYLTNDIDFFNSINLGNSEPYPSDLVVVNRYFQMFPHKNRTYIDIGAHIGTTIMPYSKKFNNIIGYEANNETFPYLQTNLKLNQVNNCSVFNQILFNKTTKGNLVKHGSNSGCYFFEPHSKGSINCTTLDDEMITKNIENVDFIKLDTEGCEYYILQGGENLLKKCKPFIMFESNGLSEKFYGISEKQIFEYLFSLGYLLYEKKNANVFFYYPDLTLNLINYNLFCLWTGYNQISITRLNGIFNMMNTTGANVKLLVPQDIKNIEIPAHPFHRGYPYLSETHKADYIRMYLMHFYGGGYSDIKTQTCNWRPFYDKLISNEQLYGIGYKEIGENGVANQSVKQFWHLLIGNCAYIFKPNTPLTKMWYEMTHSFLDNVFEDLKKFPARYPQEQKGYGYGYPISWTELLGDIFHRVIYKFHSSIDQSLSPPIFNNYR